MFTQERRHCRVIIDSDSSTLKITRARFAIRHRPASVISPANTHKRRVSEFQPSPFDFKVRSGRVAEEFCLPADLEARQFSPIRPTSKLQSSENEEPLE
ncbi:uncharacterized protein H6S33_000330 [Morchella sextelata]|uniref:uncharacterized protein n=1 Tax=Morchella sextelata TaxID=1174677 RepID=UPI001D04D612|nr:uncharacterized protein H6S33_000330 [Morchella sextelata]KAH0614694.1 hypothetical protein H6S33_000330 [Morchella sextelata]